MAAICLGLNVLTLYVLSCHKGTFILTSDSLAQEISVFIQFMMMLQSLPKSKFNWPRPILLDRDDWGLIGSKQCTVKPLM